MAGIRQCFGLPAAVESTTLLTRYSNRVDLALADAGLLEAEAHIRATRI